MSDVFISYSRLDQDFVALLREALLSQEQEIWIDWESIPPSQTWWDEIRKGIARANNFVVVLSPNSMASPICQMEIEYARQLKKRIIPVLHQDYERETALIEIAKRLAKKEETTTREIWGNRQPHDVFDANDAELKHINYFFFRPEDNFQTRFDELFAIIQTDYAHKEQHTTLALRALEWERRNHDASFLLLDSELKDAQAWLRQSAGKQPTPTDLQREYIKISEKRTRRLRNIRWASIIGTVAAIIAFTLAAGASILAIQA
ncbi:MAG: toll/interleukin-1 receptor domain-containing protein, partial [Anaerolineae bacterium]|nr:toll/interleukin-1 receptor domain-containing protein [Anaerolineae bacterium]